MFPLLLMDNRNLRIFCVFRLNGCDCSDLSFCLIDGELDLNLQLLVADQRGNAQTSLQDVRVASVKPDKMEETLTCIICQDLLHDCVRYAVSYPIVASVALAPLASVGK